MLAGYELDTETQRTAGANGHSAYRAFLPDPTNGPTRFSHPLVGETTKKVKLADVSRTAEDRPVANTEETVVLEKQVAYLRQEMRKLQDQLDQYEARDRAAVSQAAANDVAVFVLSKIVETGHINLSVLAENLLPPYGWVAFARLLQARLIQCYGDHVVPTDAGAEIAEWFEARRRKTTTIESHG